MRKKMTNRRGKRRRKRKGREKRGNIKGIVGERWRVIRQLGGWKGEGGSYKKEVQDD